MAFDYTKLQRSTTGSAYGVNEIWCYTNTSDTLATITASGYFNDANTGNPVVILDTGDTIWANGSDGNGFLTVSGVSPVTTVYEQPVITPGSITTAMLADGAVTNAKVNASAAIAFSKLAALPSAEILVGSAGNVATAVAVTGDISISNAGLTAIASGVIVNADVNASAAIAFSKLATLTSGNVLVGSAGNVPTSVAMSGDVAIIASGATTIQPAVVTTAKLDPTTIQYVKVPVTAAEFNGMYAAPFIMIAAPGAGKMIVVKQAILAMTFVSAQYLLGGAVALQYDSTANGAGTKASETVSAVTVDAYAASSSVGVAGAQASAAITTTVDKGLYLSNDTAAFTTGDSTWNVHIWYEIVTL